jgi:mono/diheme cytochrome c family protein
MPYELYAGMSDEDMAAIIAYLRSVEAEESEIPEAVIDEGLSRGDVRTAPEFDPEAEFPAPDFEDPLVRGTYLASHVSACLRCHGSLTEDGLLNPEGPASGEVVVYTDLYTGTLPSLLQADVGALTDEDFRAVFRDGVKPNGQPIFLMPVYAFHYLTDGDIEALIAWIRSQP